MIIQIISANPGMYAMYETESGYEQMNINCLGLYDDGSVVAMVIDETGAVVPVDHFENFICVKGS